MRMAKPQSGQLAHKGQWSAEVSTKVIMTPAGIALPSPTFSADREGGGGGQVLPRHEVVERLAGLRLLIGLVAAHKGGRDRAQPSVGIGSHEKQSRKAGCQAGGSAVKPPPSAPTACLLPPPRAQHQARA